MSRRCAYPAQAEPVPSRRQRGSIAVPAQSTRASTTRELH